MNVRHQLVHWQEALIISQSLIQRELQLMKKPDLNVSAMSVRRLTNSLNLQRRKGKKERSLHSTVRSAEGVVLHQKNW